MKPIGALLGRRLLVRLYLYEAFLLGVIMVSAVLVVRFVLEPSVRSERRAALTLVSEGLLADASEPARFQAALASIRDSAPMSITVFDPGGAILATTAPGLHRPLDAATSARLRQEHTLELAPGTLAVRAAPDETSLGYAVVSWREPAWVAWRAAQAFGAVLVLLGLGSIPLARYLARPVEQLAKVTRAFGLGELGARAEVHRSDELGELARAFNQMAARVETLRRAEKELLANVSHELRTPLARIRVVVELASEEEPERAKQRLADIAEDLTEVEQILGNIIEAARLDLTKERADGPFPPVRLTPVVLHPLLDNLLKRFREQHPTRRFDASVDPTITLNVDRVMFKHLVSNLLQNAEKYSSAERPIELKVERSADGSEVVLAVTDQGEGIRPEDVPHVFSPFFRADRSRTRATGGVGLGLTLVKRIVEAHGGRITLTSRVDRGTVVTVAIPFDVADGARALYPELAS
jgi:signal transduction histidine kinase